MEVCLLPCVPGREKRKGLRRSGKQTEDNGKELGLKLDSNCQGGGRSGLSHSKVAGRSEKIGRDEIKANSPGL